MTIEQLQAFVDSDPDLRQLSNQIVDYLQANPGGGGGSSSYLVYTALLNQELEDAPVATVLENTIGDIVWTRVDVGTYDATLNGAFVAGKTGLPYPNQGSALRPQWYRSNANTIEFYQENDVGNPQDGIGNTFVEIRVYPT